MMIAEKAAASIRGEAPEPPSTAGFHRHVATPAETAEGPSAR
jgi:hypothetical protein